jgi:hypothetical protein
MMNDFGMFFSDSIIPIWCVGIPVGSATVEAMDLILNFVIFKVGEETFSKEDGSSKNQHFVSCSLHNLKIDLFKILTLIIIRV